MATLPTRAGSRLPQCHTQRAHSSHALHNDCFHSSRLHAPRPSTSGRPQTCLLSASYDFASIEKTPRRVYSRVHGKQEAKRTLLLVRRLTGMTDKQFKDLGPHVAADLLKELTIARGIPGANQGRKRQENLCAKMLRDLEEGALRRLEDLVQLAESSSGQLRVDAEVRHLASTWQEALLAGNKEVEKEIYGFPRDWGLDGSRLRQLVRQQQQLTQQVTTEEQQQQAAALAGDGAGAEELAAGGSGARGGGRGKGAEQQLQRLRVKLREAEAEARAMLEPLAVRALRQPGAVEEQGDEEE